MRENEDWTVRIDSGEYSPWLGDSFDNVARYGLSFQRSQNSGRFTPAAGPNYGYYSSVDGRASRAASKEKTIFDGIPTSHRSDDRRGREADRRRGGEAMAAFTMNDPSAAVRPLVQGLKLTREAIAAHEGRRGAVLLAIKERQFQDAINSALGVELTAIAQPAGLPEPTGPGAAFAPPPLMAAPVPGQTFEVRARLANRGGHRGGAATPPGSETGRRSRRRRSRLADRARPTTGVRPGAASAGDDAVTVTLAATSRSARAVLLARTGCRRAATRLSDPPQFGRPASTPPLRAVGRYVIDGVPVELRETVRRREAKLPYGDVLREVRSVAAASPSP